MLLLSYNVFLLMMNDLLPTSGTPLIGMDAPPTFWKRRVGTNSGREVYWEKEAVCLPGCLLHPVPLPDGGQPAGDRLHHPPAARGHNPARTPASVAPLPAAPLYQLREMLSHCAPEGK
ncbi:hypothetical protein H8959_020161 [Pygathrix nigripes]